MELFVILRCRYLGKTLKWNYLSHGTLIIVLRAMFWNISSKKMPVGFILLFCWSTGYQTSNRKCNSGKFFIWDYIFSFGVKLQTYGLCQSASVISTIMYTSLTFSLYYDRFSLNHCSISVESQMVSSLLAHFP